MSMDIDLPHLAETTLAIHHGVNSPKIVAEPLEATAQQNEGQENEADEKEMPNTYADPDQDADADSDSIFEDREVSAELPLPDKASTVEDEEAEAREGNDNTEPAAVQDPDLLDADNADGMATNLDEPELPDDNDTQETSFVPDSMFGTPTPSLPPLSSPTLARLDSVYRNPARQTPGQLHSPSKLSQSHTSQGRQLNITNGFASDGAADSDDDNISLQSDLTIADLDPEEWKTMAISYGAEPRSDDFEYFNSLVGSSSKPSSKRSRKISNASNGTTGSNRSSSRLRRGQNQSIHHSSSKLSRGDGRAPTTPVKQEKHASRSGGRSKVSKTYGNRAQGASGDTGSDSNVYTSRRTTTDGTETSGESSAVEVTSARKPGVLREWTPDDGTGLYMPSSPKAKSDRKGKGRATDLAEASDDDGGYGYGSNRIPSSSRGSAAKSSRKPFSRSAPVSRGSDSQGQSQRTTRRSRQEELPKSRFKSPTPSPPPPPSEPFRSLSTATGTQALSALEIIAQMKERAKMLMAPDSEEEEQEAEKEEKQTGGSDPSGDSDLDLYGGFGAPKGKVNGAAAASSSDSEEDLMDVAALVSKAKATAAKARVSTPTTDKIDSGPRRSHRNVASEITNGIPLTSGGIAFTRGADAVTNKSKQALAKIFKSRQAEEARGWRGIAEASREEQEAVEKTRSSSMSAHANGKSNGNHAGARADSSDRDSDSSALPDEPGFAARGARKWDRSSSTKPKRERRQSEGQIQRLVNHFGSSADAQSAVEAIKLAQDEQLAQEEREKLKEEAKGWSFWKASGPELFIEPFKPYETGGCSGLDYALRKAILDGLDDPASFPAELISPYISSAQALRSTIPASYTLYHLVAHPCTEARLANRALLLLRTVLQRLQVNDSALDTDVDLSCVVASLTNMGARTEFFDEDLRRSAAIDSDDEEMHIEEETAAKVTYSPQQRTAAMLRTMMVVRTLIETGRIPEGSLPSLTTLLMRMALENGDYHVREAGCNTLHWLWQHCLGSTSFAPIEKKLLNFAEALSVKERYHIITFLPLNTDLERLMVKRLSFKFAFPAAADKLDGSYQESPSLRLTGHAIKDQTDGSSIWLAEGSDSSDLYYSVLMIQYMCTDVSKTLIADVYSSDGAALHDAQQTRGDARELVEAIQELDSKIRTDARSVNPLRNKSKNALARLQHSIEYQLGSAQKRADKAALERRLGAHSMAKQVHGRVGVGQLSLTGFFSNSSNGQVPRTTTLQA